MSEQDSRSRFAGLHAWNKNEGREECLRDTAEELRYYTRFDVSEDNNVVINRYDLYNTNEMIFYFYFIPAFTFKDSWIPLYSENEFRITFFCYSFFMVTRYSYYVLLKLTTKSKNGKNLSFAVNIHNCKYLKNITSRYL